MLGIVPRWKFFILDNGTFDMVIDYRERVGGGEAGAWRTVWAPRPRRPWGWLWKPEGFHDSVIWLAALTLDGRIAAGKPACPESSSAYATILDLCRRARHAGASEEGQFALIKVTPDGSRQNRFTSPFHIF